MPLVAAWVAQLRTAFGDDLMNDVIRRGRNGEPVFYASENGQSFGTKWAPPMNSWIADDISARRFCDGCDGKCIGTSTRCVKS